MSKRGSPTDPLQSGATVDSVFIKLAMYCENRVCESVTQVAAKDVFAMSERHVLRVFNVMV